MPENLNWDLDSVFAGGSRSAELQAFTEDLDASLKKAEGMGLPADLGESEQPRWIETILAFDKLVAGLGHARAFVGCLEAQDVKDEKARMISGNLQAFGARLQTLWTNLYAMAVQQPDPAWLALLETAALKPMAFALNEGRDQAGKKLPPEQEALVNDLSGDGYHAWGQLYNTVAGLKQVDLESDAKTVKQSLGQLQNLFFSHPDRNVRRRAYDAFNSAWEELAPMAAMALNHQAGFRLSLYRHRDWKSVLDEPLDNNRFSRRTLDTMWGVVAAESGRLRGYFDAKAKLLGIEKLTWYDVNAPVGNLAGDMTFTEAGDFVVDHTRSVNPDIADFCRMALDRRWVEAEDRPGKRAGGFCTNLPLIGESRIFMTFNGTYAGMTTLAHELGHGYHSWVIRDLPIGARHYTMSVAETASTLNELIVTDASLEKASDDPTRLALLDRKVNDAVTFFMNIRARYDFERAFFARRAKGHLGIEQLSDLMLQAQKNAYGGTLAEDGCHPIFWASKLHFFITRAPFYNFPYTFGYLFSQAVYLRARAEGKSFVERYIALLRDTGSMGTEDLAQKHLGVDLTRPKFWEETVDAVLADVDDFVRLAGRM